MQPGAGWQQAQQQAKAAGLWEGPLSAPAGLQLNLHSAAGGLSTDGLGSFAGRQVQLGSPDVSTAPGDTVYIELPVGIGQGMGLDVQLSGLAQSGGLGTLTNENQVNLALNQGNDGFYLPQGLGFTGQELDTWGQPGGGLMSPGQDLQAALLGLDASAMQQTLQPHAATNTELLLQQLQLKQQQLQLQQQQLQLQQQQAAAQAAALAAQQQLLLNTSSAEQQLAMAQAALQQQQMGMMNNSQVQVQRLFNSMAQTRNNQMGARMPMPNMNGRPNPLAAMGAGGLTHMAQQRGLPGHLAGLQSPHSTGRIHMTSHGHTMAGPGLAPPGLAGPGGLGMVHKMGIMGGAQPLRAQPPTWAGADWNPRAAAQSTMANTGTGVFLPQISNSTTSVSNGGTRPGSQDSRVASAPGAPAAGASGAAAAAGAAGAGAGASGSASAASSASQSLLVAGASAAAAGLSSAASAPPGIPGASASSGGAAGAEQQQQAAEQSQAGAAEASPAKQAEAAGGDQKQQEHPTAPAGAAPVPVPSPVPAEPTPSQAN